MNGVNQTSGQNTRATKPSKVLEMELPTRIELWDKETEEYLLSSWDYELMPAGNSSLLRRLHVRLYSESSLMEAGKDTVWYRIFTPIEPTEAVLTADLLPSCVENKNPVPREGSRLIEVKLTWTEAETATTAFWERTKNTLKEKSGDCNHCFMEGIWRYQDPPPGESTGNIQIKCTRALLSVNQTEPPINLYPPKVVKAAYNHWKSKVSLI